VFIYFPHICLLLFPRSSCKINCLPDLQKFGKNTIYPPLVSCTLSQQKGGQRMLALLGLEGVGSGIVVGGQQ